MNTGVYTTNASVFPYFGSKKSLLKQRLFIRINTTTLLSVRSFDVVKNLLKGANTPKVGHCCVDEVECLLIGFNKVCQAMPVVVLLVLCKV